MSCYMDIDSAYEFEENKSNYNEKLAENEILELGLDFYEELKNLAYMKYYRYLLLDTLRIFPSESKREIKSHANILMLEGPKYLDEPFENSTKRNRCEAVYKRKCSITYFPEKLIKTI